MTARGARKGSSVSQQEPSVCACVNVRRASRAITRVYDRALEPAQLKLTQYSVLANVKRSGPLSVSTLARILKLDRTTLVRNLKALEASGFIENCAASDPRERGIRVSEAGSEVLERAKPYWLGAQRLIEQQLGADGMAQLGLLVLSLEKLVDDSDLV